MARTIKEIVEDLSDLEEMALYYADKENWKERRIHGCPTENTIISHDDVVDDYGGALARKVLGKIWDREKLRREDLSKKPKGC